MKFSELLDKHMKDDDVIDVLESYDISVIYDFDRTHEGMDDVYWAASTDAGFQFRFDKNQMLDTIFLYMVAREGFTPISRNNIDVPVFDTFDDAERECRSKGIPFKQSQGTPGSDMYKWWIKLDYGTHTAHYQFKEGTLRMVTLGARTSSQ
ncbi:hypothetical protein [Undibacterium umbellatum]|uniref:Uncharacterized protein n=1 Tax=Undibacterium umbellatum TaxID=2762300 RepID=A0ABR6ZIP3_9BURK|nr:hypothetical protein [Undibacterium umbellatum]MBC3911565.1 hypothetical protein [Undibacterium umbellatum]